MDAAQKQRAVLGGLVLVLALAAYAAVNSIWGLLGIDWKETFYPAARAVLNGQSPYTVPTFRNAPWLVVLLAPFAILPERPGGVLFFLASLILYALTAFRLKASRIALIAFLLSPPVVYGLRMLNVDVFVLLGFTLPAPLGLFFVALKPQMGAVMIPFWLAQAWRRNGFRGVAQTFLPFTLACAVSFLIFGNWLAGRQADLLNSFWNASLFPWSLPVGVVLAALALRDDREDLAMSASPFLSPYLAYHSWAAVLTGLLRRDFELILAVVSMWLVALIRAL